MWLAIAILGYVLLAGVNILDKFILSGRSVKPLVFVFYSSVSLLPLALLLPFGVDSLVGGDWLVALTAGASFVLALWFLYASFANSEISHIGPLTGGTVPLFILGLNIFFLGESFNQREYLGVLLLILGCFAISFEQGNGRGVWHRGALWALVSSFFFAISHITSKLIYNDYGFYSGLVWTRVFVGVVGLLVLFWPSVRKEIFSGKKKEVAGKKNSMVLIFANKFLAVVGVGLTQYAIAIGSVVIVNALAGVQYAILVGAVAFFSRFFPGLVHENYTRSEIWQEIFAVTIIAVGLFFLI